MTTPVELVTRLRAAGCVFAEEEAALLAEAADSPADLEHLVARRIAGEPLEHVVGWVEFGGLRLVVGPGVFVPRQRTVALAESAATAARERVSATGRPPVVVDLCCGCGAIGAVVADRLAHDHPADVHAADHDAAAVTYAAANLAPFGGHAYTGDLFDPLPDRIRGHADVVVANVPYVPSTAVTLMPHEARDHEPRAALDGGHDGLAVARRLVTEAPAWLAPGGVVMIECHAGQSAAAAEAMRAAGLAPAVEPDDHRDVTIVSGTLR